MKQMPIRTWVNIFGETITLLKFNRIFIIIVAVGIVLITGCNAFEAVDSNFADKTFSDKIANGNIALAQGEYTQALDIFTLLAKNGDSEDGVLRGRGEAEAGQAGFRLLDILNAQQNGLKANNTSKSWFSSIKRITDFTSLEKALSDISRISSPTNNDKLLEACLAVNMVCHKLLEKYDTNFNGKLDSNDEIDFDTNDDKTDNWQQLFKDFTQSPSSMSLEQAFNNAAIALNGRGGTWAFITPINGVEIKGNYSKANRSTVTAIGDLADTLELANEYFDKDVTSFKDTIIKLDGNEE